MDRKGWPWRKKSSDKIVSAADNLDPSSKQSEDHESPSFYGYQMRTSGEMTQLLQAEAKVKNLNEQLSAALLDVTAKDTLVKQHAKVAEEAVTGWEKAEAEAVALKQKLDVALQQKLATEDRVSHLDGALKECMRQLRHVREEQEQQIHDIVVKKTREWEKVRLEMEAKLADVGHQLLEAGTENNAMSKTLQERARSILEANKAKSHDEAKIKELQICLEATEIESTKLKYEVHVLTKELEIRNEEREYNKKAGDAASKQHLENVKKIAKLEAECQRLRLLVRKRLPGPAALAQMKLEVEALGKETGERIRRRSPCRRNDSPVPSETTNDTLQEDVFKEAEILSSRLLAMEEETKLLKEVIAKRNSELQAARLMCARMASKLSSVEEQLVNLSRTHGLPKTPCMPLERQIELPLASIACKEPSLASMSEYGGTEDEVSCAESWASALIAELAQFKKEKAGAGIDKMLESTDFDLMNDFAEMEKLASLSSENNSSISGEAEKILEMVCRTDENNQGENRSENMEHSEGILTKQKEESGNGQCEELQIKLAHAEEQFDGLQAKQATIEAILASLQQRLVTILDAEAKETSASKIVEEVKKAITAFKAFETQQSTDFAVTSCRSCLETLSHESRSAQTWSPRSHSEENHYEDDAVAPSAAKSKPFAIVPELAAAVRKVLGLAEGLAESDFSFSLPTMPVHDSGSNVALETGEGQGHADMGKQWRSLEFDACIQSLVMLCNGLLQGKVDIIDFVAEVASALDWLMDHIILVSEKTPVRISKRKQLNWGKGSPSASDSEVLSSANSFVPTSKKRDLEYEDMPEPPAPNLHQRSVSDDRTQPPVISSKDEQFSKIITEKEDLEIKLEVEMKKNAWVESEFAKFKSEKGEIEQDYKLANENLEHTKKQLQDSEQRAIDLLSQLSTALVDKQSVELNLATLLSAKQVVESELEYMKASLKDLKQKLAAIEIELQDERKGRKDAETKFEELQQQQLLLRDESQSTRKENEMASIRLSANEAKLKKEQEIAAAAEKLAECQQTILVLGKQLKSLGVSKDPVESSSPHVQSSFNLVPSTTRRLHESSDQLQCTDESGDARHHTVIEFSEATSSSLDWPSNEWDRRLENENSRVSLNSYISGTSDTQPSIEKRGHSGGRYGGLPHGRKIPSEIPRGNGSLSPLHGNYDEGMGFISSSPLEPVSSPARSPARFSSLRNRISGGHDSTKHVSGESDSSSEKHGTGFSRFFSRTRTGH